MNSNHNKSGLSTPLHYREGQGGGSATQYIELFAQCEAMISKHSAEVLNSLRAKAFEDFKRLGFSTRKDEDYKYTDVSKAFEPDYGLNLNRLDIPVNPYDVFKCDVPNMSTALYFVANDSFYNKALPKSNLPEGVLLGSLKELSESYPELVGKYYGKLAETSKDAVVALNTMLAQDGLLLYVPKGVVVEKPIQLVNILRADVNFMVNRRVLVILEDGARARLLMCDHAMDKVDFLATQVIEAYVGSGATLDFYELEENTTATRRFSYLNVYQEADSNVLVGGITLHNGLTRNTTRVTLAGQGAYINLSGMAIADKNQHVDNHTFIDHQVPDCTSRELYKYVLDDSATGAFAGKVLVREGAQHTASEQTNRNLCVTRQARMYTQPQLEIYADDVKCSHGATVGQLDENALFYMRQRGVSEQEARLLLMFAFVGDVVDNIRLDALRDRLHLLVEKRFRGEMGKCQGCTMCK
ncbi:MAG: Fe-S cluster assembly protein SufD [Bacteroidaceae bacterium]|nr:Fe-S cluster assembly protein SufD [Bacteroidaceae bacterium]